MRPMISRFVSSSAMLQKAKFHYFACAYWPANHRLAAEYLRSTGVPKLNLGCGDNLLTGWLNTDFRARRGICSIDATRPLPYPDNSFRYVFTEHMIEHLSYQSGRQLASEAFRVLAGGGRIRVTTPDMAFLFRLYGDESAELHSGYIGWGLGAILSGPTPNRDHGY